MPTGYWLYAYGALWVLIGLQSVAIELRDSNTPGPAQTRKASRCAIQRDPKAPR